MIKPIIDTFCQLPYQIDYAQSHFQNKNYHHLSKISDEQYNDLMIVLRYLLSVGLQNTNSYNRYRNEVEKLVLWLWYQQNQTLAHIDEALLKEYLHFLQSPPEGWQTTRKATRFKLVENVRVYNPHWRPFIKATKCYESRASTYTILNHFCNHLCDTKIIQANPVKALRKRDSVLNNTTKPLSKVNEVSYECIESQFAKWQNDIHRVRDLLLYYFVKHKNVMLQSFSLQGDGFYPQLAHLDISSEIFYFYQNGQLQSRMLCPLGLKMAEQYILLRGSQTSKNAPLLHKQRGEGCYEVRQLRRMIKSVENELNTDA